MAALSVRLARERFRRVETLILTRSSLLDAILPAVIMAALGRMFRVVSCFMCNRVHQIRLAGLLIQCRYIPGTLQLCT